MTRPKGGSGSARRDRQNARDWERRQVRTRNPSRRRRRTKGKLPKLKLGGPATMSWSVITIVLSIVALVAQTTVWIVLAVVSMGVTAIVRKVEAKQAGQAVPRRPSKIPPKANPRGSGGRGGSSGSSGTGRGGRGGGGSGSGKRVCGEACKRSTKPKRTCRCTAPDCAHGSLAAGGKIPIPPDGSGP